LVNQQRKEKQKMTPNDIATSISGLRPVGEASIANTVTYTYTFEKMDDANNWG